MQSIFRRIFVSSCQMVDTSLSESPEEEEDSDSPAPNKGSYSPQNRPSSPSSDHWQGSPRKRTQTLPAFNCPLTGMAAKAEALNRWSRIQETSEEKSGTFSEDIFKILDLRGSGSLFGGSSVKTEEGEETLTTQLESDSTGSSSAGSQNANSEAQASLVTAPQKSVTEVPEDSSAQHLESRAEQQSSEQQLTERWGTTENFPSCPLVSLFNPVEVKSFIFGCI